MYKRKGDSYKGTIYKNFQEKTKYTGSFWVWLIWTLVVFAVPIVLAVMFDPAYLFVWIGSFIGSMSFLASQIDSGYKMEKLIISSDDEACYTQPLSATLTKEAIALLSYREELATIVSVDLLFTEIFDKVRKYEELVKFDAKAAREDIENYTDKLVTLIAECSKIKQDKLTTTNEVLNSALELRGILKES